MARALSRFVAAIFAATITLKPSANAIDVGTCAEFEAVDRTTETDVTITNADFTCDEYTRLSIKSDMVLRSSMGPVTFANFSLKVLGSLVVEPDVVFTGISDVDKNGGAVKVELGASAVFQGTAEFTDISVLPREDTARLYRKGAALHNKGDVTFEQEATFSNCFTGRQTGQQYDDNGNELSPASSGGGGAIYLLAKGTITFLGDLTMTDNTAESYSDATRGEGGAIYSRGDIVVEGSTYLASNFAQEGGAIFQERWATITFNGRAGFGDNEARNVRDFGDGPVDRSVVLSGVFSSAAAAPPVRREGRAVADIVTAVGGGAIHNHGGVVTFNGESTFDYNRALSAGASSYEEGEGYGGAIYNFDGGHIEFRGDYISFTDNEAWVGGAIAIQEDVDNSWEEEEGRTYKVPTISFNTTATPFFEVNRASNVCDDIAYVSTDGVVCESP